MIFKHNKFLNVGKIMLYHISFDGSIGGILQIMPSQNDIPLFPIELKSDIIIVSI